MDEITQESKNISSGRMGSNSRQGKKSRTYVQTELNTHEKKQNGKCHFFCSTELVALTGPKPVILSLWFDVE